MENVIITYFETFLVHKILGFFCQFLVLFISKIIIAQNSMDMSRICIKF